MSDIDKLNELIAAARSVLDSVDNPDRDFIEAKLINLHKAIACVNISRISAAVKYADVSVDEYETGDASNRRSFEAFHDYMSARKASAS